MALNASVKMQLTFVKSSDFGVFFWCMNCKDIHLNNMQIYKQWQQKSEKKFRIWNPSFCWVSFTQLVAHLWFWPVTISALLSQILGWWDLSCCPKEANMIPRVGWHCSYWLLPVTARLDWSETAGGKLLAVLSWPEREWVEITAPLERKQWFIWWSISLFCWHQAPQGLQAGGESINHQDNEVQVFAALVYTKPEVLARYWLEKTVSCSSWPPVFCLNWASWQKKKNWKLKKRNSSLATVSGSSVPWGHFSSLI